MPSEACKKTPPAPILLASSTDLNGLSTFGVARTGALSNIILVSSNDF